MKAKVDSLELLRQTHDFPCPVMVKVIGKNEDDFDLRVVRVIRDTLQTEVNPTFRTRETTGGRHISVTTEPTFPSAEDVLRVYAALRSVEGIVLMM